MSALCTSPQCQTTAGCICGSFETRHGGWDWGKNNVVFSRGFRHSDTLFEIDAMERKDEAMSADIPRSVMEEAVRIYEDAEPGTAYTLILARALIARDKRAAGIASAMGYLGEIIADRILAYPDATRPTEAKDD
jgi:hypothetical protein